MANETLIDKLIAETPQVTVREGRNDSVTKKNTGAQEMTGKRRHWNTQKLDIVGLFKDRELYDRPFDGKPGMHSVTCPWDDEHSTDRKEASTSAVVWEGIHGRHAAFNCKHGHCEGRTIENVCDQWPDIAEEFGASRSFPLTEEGNAERLAALHGRDLLYWHDRERWLIWDGTRWKPDRIREVESYAVSTVRSLFADAKCAEGKEDRDRLIRFEQISESEKGLNALLRLARKHLPVTTDELDRDPILLNCRNGTLDLRDGWLRPHFREDRITRQAPAAFDPQATCPNWLAFLWRVTGGNERMMSFLQRAVGYSLTGDTREKCFFILHGPSDSGKTTFLETIGRLVGDYGAPVPPDLLLTKREGSIPNDLAKLKGARFVWTSETEEGRRLATALVKAMTGRDRLNARFLHQEWFDFTGQFKLWFATNHKPVIRETGDAIWGRVRLIPFFVSIPEAEQDKELANKLKSEEPGILAWAVRGALEWRAQGLPVPAEVRDATSAYRREMDLLGQFIDERCHCEPQAQATSTALHTAYVNWCREHGEHPISQKQFGPMLVDRGFQKLPLRHATYGGIRPLNDWERQGFEASQ